MKKSKEKSDYQKKLDILKKYGGVTKEKINAYRELVEDKIRFYKKGNKPE